MDNEYDKAWVDVISGIEEEDLVSLEVIDKLINDHKSAIKEHKAEIKRSEKSIKTLELKRLKLRFGSNTVIFGLADQLAGRNFKWENFEETECELDQQQSFYIKAKKIIETARELNVSIPKAIRLVTL
jgi:hypothetical protein